LATNSFALSLARDGLDASVPSQLGDALASHHLRWQRDSKSSLDEKKFTRSVNDHFDLNRSPEYLRIGIEQVRKVRMLIWMRVPELSTGVERRGVQPGGRVVSESMSPFEAFLAADWLLYYKSYEPEYVRTPGEPVPQRPAELDRPGIHFLPADERCLQFQRHLESLAMANWHRSGAIVKTVNEILEESRNDR
jgi:hypothetical protein